MKRSQAISINTIVVAAIALVVLLLIVMIFTTNIKNWIESASSCDSANGQCVLEADIANLCSGEYQRTSGHTCPDTPKGEKQKCCLLKNEET